MGTQWQHDLNPPPWQIPGAEGLPNGQFLALQVLCIFSHFVYFLPIADLWQRRGWYMVPMVFQVWMVYNSIALHLCMISRGSLGLGQGYAALLLKDMTTAQFQTLWLVLMFIEITSLLWFNGVVLLTFIVFYSVMNIVGDFSYVTIICFGFFLYLFALPSMAKDRYHPVLFGLAVIFSVLGLVCYFLSAWYNYTHWLWHIFSGLALFFWQRCYFGSRANGLRCKAMAEYPESLVVDDRDAPIGLPSTLTSELHQPPAVVYMSHVISLWRIEGRLPPGDDHLPAHWFCTKISFVGYIYIVWGLIASSAGRVALRVYAQVKRREKAKWTMPTMNEFFRTTARAHQQHPPPAHLPFQQAHPAPSSYRTFPQGAAHAPPPAPAAAPPQPPPPSKPAQSPAPAPAPPQPPPQSKHPPGGSGGGRPGRGPQVMQLVSL